MKYINLIVGIVSTCILALVLSLTPAHADLNDTPIIFVDGAWSVHIFQTPASNKGLCVGVYKNNYNIRLTDTALYIYLRGGVKSVKLRYGNIPAREYIRKPSAMEGHLSILALENDEFKSMLTATNVHIEVSTIMGTTQTYDIIPEGIVQAVAKIHSGCAR